MKAILVVDVPVLDDGRHLCNECPIWNREKCFCEYDRNMEEKGCPLKPMPRKLDANDWHRMFSGLFSEREAKGYGWNACLDEMTGETE